MQDGQEFLIGLLGEQFFQRSGEIAEGLRDGIKGGLGEVAQGGSAAPD